MSNQYILFYHYNYRRKGQQMFRLVKREQILKGLLDSFQQKENKLRRKVFHIDRSFKHNELEMFGEAERYIFQEKIGECVQKERKEIQEEEKQEDREQFVQMSIKLKQFGRRQDHSKTVYLLNHPKKTQLLSTQIKIEQKKIFIQRKYNTQLSYQFHSIMQAKKIQDAREKMMEQMSRTQESPLINDILKLTRNEKKTDELRQQYTRLNSCPKPKINKFRSSVPAKKILHENKQLLQVCQRQYTHPTIPNMSSSFSKYGSRDQVYRKSKQPSTKNA